MHSTETKQNEYYEILDQICLNLQCQTVKLADKVSEGDALLLKPAINVRGEWRDIGEKSCDTVNHASVMLGLVGLPCQCNNAHPYYVRKQSAN